MSVSLGEAQRFFEENPQHSAVIAAVNNVDASNVGDSATVTYDFWLNTPTGQLLFPNVMPQQGRPPAGQAIIAAREGHPAVVHCYGTSYRFQVIGEWQATTEDCTPAAQAQTGAPS